ncbi:MAG: hypothetical protein MUE85_13260 [Microscillaceae bacterium]|jgi:hypothetical protein|nr:hypothetical protein [Microscillaceae bacterium]
MESLNELIGLITQKRVKKVELFDESSRNKTSNYFKLFEGIHNEKYLTDEEAAQDIYACEASEKKYLILKTRLKQKLLNTLFFLDIAPGSDVSDYEVAYYDCQKNLYQVKVLLLNKAYGIAIPIVEKVLKKAQEYGITEMEYECATILRKYFAETNQYKDFLLHKAMADRVEQKMFTENASDRYWEELQITYTKTKSNKESVNKLAEEYAQTIQKDMLRYNSPKLKSNYLKIKTFQSQLTDDYKLTLQLLNEHEKHLRSHAKLVSPHQIESLQLEKMNAYFHLKDYESGEKYQAQISDLHPEKDNWYVLQEYRLLLAMHTAHYVEASQIFHHTVEQNSFKHLAEAQKERWLVFQAYMHYIYKSQKVKSIRLLTQNSKIDFRLSDFIDDRPAYAKNRRGINIAILSAQILFYLEKMDTEGISDCIQALEPYSRRYPKKDANYRSECFIAMLTEMWREDFRFYQTRKNSEKHYTELIATPMEYRGGNKALEVLPYEMMWNAILEKLKQFRYG